MTAKSLEEYDEILSQIAQGPHGGVMWRVEGHAVHLTPLVGVSVASSYPVKCSVGLRVDRELGALRPEVSIDSSSCLSSDPAHAMAELDMSRRTILAAIGLARDLSSITVYVGDVPCSYCSRDGRACRRCGGTGIRVKRAEGGE